MSGSSFTGPLKIKKSDGTKVTFVDADGDLVGDIQDTLAEGSIYVGNSSNVTSELDASTDTAVLIGNGTTITSAALSGDVTMANTGAATVAAVDLETATVTNIADTELLIGTGAGTANFAVMSGDATLANTGALTIAAGAVENSMVADSAAAGGLFVKKIAQCVYDFSVDGGTEGTITLASTATIPDNAIVTATHYDVLTTCTSSSDAATIKLNLPTDGDISTAIAISDGTNPWDAGAHLGSVITPLAVKTTGARALQIITAGGQDLTAGKIAFFVEYFVTE